MPRSTRPAALAAFLANLADTGNVRLAAERCGLARSGLFKRRRRDPAFARDWDAAIESCSAGAGEPAAPCDAPRPSAYRTESGDLAVTVGRRPQLRRSPAGRLTAHGQAAFLAQLSRTANIRLSAAQVGIAAASIHARRRRDPAFAAAVAEALALGTVAIEAALVESALSLFDPDAPPLDPAHPVALPASFMDAIRLLRVRRR